LPAPAATTSPARAEPAQGASPNEIAGFVRRAQELLASGDMPGARTYLTRAAEAHDARAALLLAKTFDPMVSRHLSGADQGPDVAQARDWYQKAREWGAPEAQRQLDALASYPRNSDPRR
jgi:TPR repeat protein